MFNPSRLYLTLAVGLLLWVSGCVPVVSPSTSEPSPTSTEELVTVTLVSASTSIPTSTSTPSPRPSATPGSTQTRVPPTVTPSPSTLTTAPTQTTDATTATTPADTVEPSPTVSTATPSAPPATSTATPTATPTAIPTAMPTATSVPDTPSLALYETSLTLQSYGWEEALVPSTQAQPFYPYPALDFGALAPPAPRTYQAVVLENAYVRVTLVPALGGRVLVWEDRVTGQRLTYRNPVVKPTHWGYRGWWLATGGLEWAFPVNEHGLNEYRPWQYAYLSGDGWRGVRVWDTDDRTGMSVAVTLRLAADSSTLTIAPRIANPTGEARSLQFWINAMLTLSGGNTPSPSLHFWVPTETMMVHSTGDGSLPGPRGVINWPIHGGRDFSQYSAWRQYLGLFATEARGAAGAYDEATDQGIVRSYPPQVARGVKIFSLGDLPADIYTDGASRYVEFWGGLNRTFFPEDDVVLQPGGVVAWEEQWYPVHGIGHLGWANEKLAAGLVSGPGGVEVGVYAPRWIEAPTLVLRQQGELRAEWTPEVNPATPFRTRYAGNGGSWELEIWQADSLLTTLSTP